MPWNPHSVSGTALESELLSTTCVLSITHRAAAPREVPAKYWKTSVGKTLALEAGEVRVELEEERHGQQTPIVVVAGERGAHAVVDGCKRARVM